jgi:hypothetical protein
MKQFANFADVKVGDKMEIDSRFSCHDPGIVEIKEHPVNGLFFDCDAGHHYLDGQKDEFDYLRGMYSLEEKMNDLIPMPVCSPSPLDLTNPESLVMLQNAIALVANGLVEASALAVTVKEIQATVVELREAITVANYQREVADVAYQQVNAQRIDAETELARVQNERNNLQADLEVAARALSDARAERDLYKEEVDRVIADANETIASARAKTATASEARLVAEEALVSALTTIETIKEELATRKAEVEQFRNWYQTETGKTVRYERVLADIKAISSMEQDAG